MKKILIFLFVTISCFCANSQTEEHIKFMGIPLGISIKDFQKQLKPKGFKSDDFLNQFIPDGGKAFKGGFVGYQARFFTYYDTKTKKVFKVRIVINNSSLKQAESVFDDIINLYRNKYPDVLIVDYDEKEYKTSDIYLKDVIGYMTLFILPGENFATNGTYDVYLDFYDTIETKAHEKNRSDDL